MRQETLRRIANLAVAAAVAVVLARRVFDEAAREIKATVEGTRTW